MRILIADDESIYRDLLAGIISRWPEHQVTVVENGLEAWKRLDEPGSFFDVVFLDIKMPGLNGLEVLQRIRGTPKLLQTAIVLCTSHGDYVTISKAVQLRANHILIKPPTAATIAEKLRMISMLSAQSNAGSNALPQPPADGNLTTDSLP